MNEELKKLLEEVNYNLDYYEYAGYTYKEYTECIERGIHGDKSLRYMYLNNKHVWSTIMQEPFDLLKDMIHYNYFTPEKISKCITKLNNTEKSILTFMKQGLYTIQCENIINAIKKIINILENKNI